MSTRYEETKPPRFAVETVDGGEQIRIGARLSPFPILFLPVWLCFWTFGGISAMRTLWSGGFQPFLVVWLGGWLLGELFALATLSWMLSGAEIVRVVGSDLEIGYHMLGFARRRLFHGSEIGGLSSSAPLPFSRYNQMPMPFVGGSKTGAVKFTYGARTVYFGAALDEAEGRLIVERLRRRLPSSATA